MIGGRDGRLEAQVDLDAGPLAGLAVSRASVWGVDPERASIVRIDRRELKVADTIPIAGGVEAIDTDDSNVWAISSGTRSVLQINATAGRPVRRAPVGNGARALAIAHGSVWVANALDATLSRIDRSSARVLATIAVGAGPSGVAATADAVWVANEPDGTVTRIDPARNIVTATIRVGNGPSAIVAAGDAPWVLNASDGTVSRIEPARNAISATIQVPGARAVAADEDSVWIGGADAGTLQRVDARTGAPARTTRVGSPVRALALVDGRLWAATRATQASRRGGTLVRHDPGFDGSIDPGRVDDTGSTPMVAIVSDGLLGHRRAGGAAGVQIVPDLARSLPQIEDEGRTYRFQLRSGVRYSTGSPVRAQDVRASIERLHRMRAPTLVAAPLGLVGEPECGAARCDLSPGIETDEASRSVTFRLRQPNVDFLENLASPGYAVLPAGTPARDVTGPALAATGPYRVAAITPGRRLVLERNPRFRVWSDEAQPAGAADRVVWDLTAGPATARRPTSTRRRRTPT